MTKLTWSRIDFPEARSEILPEGAEEPSAKPRGTTLLEAFEDCLPNINSLDEKRHLQFVKAIDLLCHFLKLKQSWPENRQLPESRSMINNLKQLYNQYLDSNTVIASAILIVMTHIESYYLDDQDARLVHDLTGLHIHRPIECA
ncbi:MAG: hypothetical protein JO223_01520 [Hyphomicrobiales bacterium]|nr:hypothetical protein [Hyphomicrobiales bacterium]MBV8442531.1 hypothetical protein [Hyphomicrobiales bacterium]